MQGLLIIIGLSVGMGGCIFQRSPSVETLTGTPPSLLLGDFKDDHGNRFTITPQAWLQHPGTRYHVVRWETEAQYLLAQNDSANASDGGLWTRIDWMEFSEMAPYHWGFCLSAYAAPTAAEAEATAIAERESPRTGCNGFPFSRMRRQGREAH